MKFTFLLAFQLFAASLRLLAQDADDKFVAAGLDRRTVVRNDTLFLFYVAEENKVVTPLANRLYYWFNKDTVLVTPGGFGGRVLNGDYKVYYPGKRLKESGQFRYGLKDGTWKEWNPDGSLNDISHWNKGKELSGEENDPAGKKKKSDQ